MQQKRLIEKILATDDAGAIVTLIAAHRRFVDIQLARDLKDTYYTSWTTAPEKTRSAAAALEIAAKIIATGEARALARWVRGIADLTEGKLRKAIRDLDAAATILLAIGLDHNAAETQVAKLIALAMLGEYDEAVRTGGEALKVFERHRDTLAAGKIEKNLGNIVARQGRESDAEKYYLRARRRFVAVGDLAELAMCDNSLANTYAELNDFRKAEKFYASSLEIVRRARMHVTEAEIEASMGNLALFRGRFDEALRFLELSRQKYDDIKMPHQSAIAEMEIADIYLELNLAEEAINIYECIAASFRDLKMQGEEARSRAGLARAYILRGEPRRGLSELKRSAQLYLNEKNPNGAAGVMLAQADIELGARNSQTALDLIREAIKLAAKGENLRLKLYSNWLYGEALVRSGRRTQAAKILTETLDLAKQSEQQNLAQNCLNSLGALAVENGECKAARQYFSQAVKMVETLRSPLAGEEFRMSFMANRLAPYTNLAKLHIADGDIKRAFAAFENARARTLSENVDGSDAANTKASPKLTKQLAVLREKLNWHYSRLAKADPYNVKRLEAEARTLEKQIGDLMRQIASTQTHGNSSQNISVKEDELVALQRQLGDKKALIEFVSLDGEISAFVVTNKAIDLVRSPTRESEIYDLLEGVQFQFGALRFGKSMLGSFAEELKRRADTYFGQLHQKLIEPIGGLIDDRDLVIVPVGPLHYVPFQALYDGERYLIESREISYAPSAAVWTSLNARRPRNLIKTLLIGFADEAIPLVNEEVSALRKMMPAAVSFTGKKATFANYKTHAGEADILHLACHGQFRSDNPMFSSLHLADGFVTVADISVQRLRAEVVTLSACETGLNKLYAGDEILGLARGFLSAGAASLVLSLWTVNDEATVRLMKDLYRNLQRSRSVAASLRQAQCAFIARGEHPYYWSSFSVIGK